MHAEAQTAYGWAKGVGAGIGGGDNGNGGMVRIYGGRVYASSLPVDYTLYHAQGAGIGGGDSGYGGRIDIYGGEVESHGYHAFGNGKDYKGGNDPYLFLGDGMIVDGFGYSERYKVFHYGRDIWVSNNLVIVK